MKKINIYIASLVLMLITGRCKEINPFEGVSLVVSEGKVNSPVLLQFIDANPESNSLPDNVTVKITSDKASYILNDAGGKNYKVAGNILTLKLANELVASQSAPVKFTVEAEAPGYLTTSQTYTLDSADPAQFVMSLVNIKNPPKGVAVTQTTVSASGGQITVSDGGVEVGNVAFKSGTQVMDATGNIINAANINTEVVMFDAEEIQSLSAFPGGLMPENVLFNSGQSQDIRFVSLGFVAINMNAGGKEVKKFSKPIEVSMVVSPDIKNPVTGEPTKEGSVIPTWSFETSTGKWKEEGVAVVSKNSKGELVAKFEASHLSYWNIDYYLTRGNACPDKVTFKVSSNVTYSTYGQYTTLNLGRVFDEQGNFIGSTSSFNITNGAEITMNQAFDRSEGKMKLMVYGWEGLLGETTFDACAASVPINITLPNPPKLVTVNIDITAICKNKDLKLKPNTWITLSDNGTPIIASFQNGKASVLVRDDRNWHVSVYYDGAIYGAVANFSRKGTTVTSTGNLTGTASYDATTDTITYTAEYLIANCK